MSGITPGGGGRKKGSRSLTPQEKAEAIALWRVGEVTLEELAKKFKKRPETFSRLFKAAGVKKGELSEAHQQQVAQAVETRLLNDAEELANRIAKSKDEHYRMSKGLATLVWSEIVECRKAKKPLSSIKETMQTLNLAANTLGKVRDEIWSILQIERHDERSEDEDLPELTIRELTEEEVTQMSNARAPSEDLEGIEDLGDIVEGDEHD